MRPWIPLLALCLTTAASPARAGVPDPSMSTVDPCLRGCPSGDAPFVAVIRDAFFNPVVNSTVVINFLGCPEVRLCPTVPGDNYIINGRNVIAVTDAQGRVEIRLRAGGVCAALAPIQADGVLMGSRATASFDQDGSLTVDAADAAIAGTKVGTNDPTADLDCDGTVTLLDVNLIAGPHAGHFCDIPTRDRQETWGRLKTIYR